MTSFAEYYHALKHAWPIPTDEAKHPIRCALIGVDAHGLYAHHQVVLDQLEDEIFPDTCTDLIEDWERSLAIVPPSGATLADRRVACWSKWGGGLGTSTRDLRRALAPLLNPATAFRDKFGGPAGVPEPRWLVVSGNGTVLVDGSGGLVVAIAAGQDGDIGHMPIALVGTVDRNDAVTVEADVTSCAVADETEAGIIIFRDSDNAIMIGHANDGGELLSVTRIDEGVFSAVWTGTAPTAPYTISVRADDSTVTVEVDGVEVWSGAQGFVTARSVGVYARNDATSKRAVSLTLAEFRYFHDLPENNVELWEKWSAIVADQTELFAAFVHRDPTDPGSYNLTEAQRTANRMKLGNTYIAVGESDFLLCDDPYSLTERDITGRA